MSAEDCISSRAVACVPQAPKFFDVLDDLWHPESNPDGVINLGLAENASKLMANASCNLLTHIVIDAN